MLLDDLLCDVKAQSQSTVLVVGYGAFKAAHQALNLGWIEADASVVHG